MLTEKLRVLCRVLAQTIKVSFAGKNYGHKMNLNAENCLESNIKRTEQLGRTNIKAEAEAREWKGQPWRGRHSGAL